MKKLVGAILFSTCMFANQPYHHPGAANYHAVSPDSETKPTGRKYDSVIKINSDEVKQYPGATYFYYLLKNNHTKSYDTIVGHTPSDVVEEVKRVSSEEESYAGNIFIIAFGVVAVAGFVYFGYKRGCKNGK